MTTTNTPGSRDESRGGPQPNGPGASDVRDDGTCWAGDHWTKRENDSLYAIKWTALICVIALGVVLLLQACGVLS